MRLSSTPNTSGLRACALRTRRETRLGIDHPLQSGLLIGQIGRSIIFKS